MLKELSVYAYIISLVPRHRPGDVVSPVSQNEKERKNRYDKIIVQLLLCDYLCATHKFISASAET